MSRLRELEDIIEEARREMRKKGKDFVQEKFADFFTKYPEVEAVTWVQYIPHFNDGDVCTFGACDFELENGNELYRADKVKCKEIMAALDKIRISNETLETIFGDDGLRISVSADGIETEEYYDHD